MNYLKSRGVKDRTFSTFFSEAISEGIREALNEMEYKKKNCDEKQNEQPGWAGIFRQFGE